MFDLRDIGVLYRRELRCALRERTIIVNSIVLQIVLYPALLWLIYSGISFVQGQTEGFTSRVALAGLPEEHRSLREELERDERLALTSSSDPESDLHAGRLDLLAEFEQAPGAPAEAGNFKVRLAYDESRDRSRLALERMTEIIARYRDRFVMQAGARLGLEARQLQPIWVAARNTASGRQMGEFILGRMLPVFLIIMIAVGCMYPAIDSTAGEREKSTWETTMTFAVSRANIVAAKYLYVSTMAACAGILNLAAMLLTVKSVLAPILGEQVGRLTFAIPLAAVPLIVLMDILLAMFVAAGMMILASFARNFREGQSMVSPFYVAVFIPIIFLQAPGVELTPVTAALPVVNVALIFRDAISGVYRWPLIGLALAVEAASVALLLLLAAAVLRHEDFVIGSCGGSLGRFLKQRVFRAGARREGAV